MVCIFCCKRDMPTSPSSDQPKVGVGSPSTNFSLFSVGSDHVGTLPIRRLLPCLNSLHDDTFEESKRLPVNVGYRKPGSGSTHHSEIYTRSLRNTAVRVLVLLQFALLREHTSSPLSDSYITVSNLGVRQVLRPQR